ncbi:MAG TPA: polysaccharide deacetylase family protein [Armatimonadota bacterium]|jgi:peptidoglycan/xylan/chitin deacetylase (PgdA/CDA1 family)
MATTPTRIEIPAFPAGKRIAVTTSWDDGRVYDRWVVEVLNRLGLKGTFNLNSAKLRGTGTPPSDMADGYLDAAEVATLFAGHEVAVHTVNHPNLERLDPLQIADEVLGDRRALEALVGYPVRGMAYPYGTYNARVIDVLRMLGIVYSRTTGAEVTSFPPAEPLAWASTMHALHETPTPLPARWEAFYARGNGVFYVWGHSYEFAKKRELLEPLFAHLAHKPDVWYCTNIALFDYEDARQRLVIAADKRSAYNPSALPVTVNVDGTLRDLPPGVSRLDEA